MEIIVLSVLILINGFFALSEIALVSSKKAKLENFKKMGKKGASVALKLKENSENFLSAIQVGITLIGIVTGVYGGVNIAGDVAPYFEKITFLAAYANQIALTLTVIAITYVSIVIGELVPKTIAITQPEKIAIRVAPTILVFSKISYPFVIMLSSSTSFINKVLGIKSNNEQMTEEELKQMLKIASSEGVIEKEQNVLHEKLFYFSDKKAKHIMTHRTDVEWIDIEKPFEELHHDLINSKHSKLIACRHNIDEFVGIISINKYLISFHANNKVDILSVIADPIVIPENANAQSVLNYFKQKQTYITVVVNEYGEFEGIITLHDIIENIIGSMPEKGENNEPDVFVREDKSVLVSGEAPIETLIDIIDNFTIDFESVEYATVAGFVLFQINKIPQMGDKFQYQNYSIEIVDIDGNKIDKILITPDK